MINKSKVKSQKSKTFNFSSGFTLIEVLVALTVLSIISVLFVEIIFRTLRDSNKAQITGVIKQNGQIVLDNIDRTVRNADAVICPAPNEEDDILIVQKDSNLIAFRFFPQTSSANGFILQDNPTSTDCDAGISSNAIFITNTDINNGVSINSATFRRNTKVGYEDLVTINFVVGPAINIPKTLNDSADPVTFSTTVKLR